MPNKRPIFSTSLQGAGAHRKTGWSLGGESKKLVEEEKMGEPSLDVAVREVSAT